MASDIKKDTDKNLKKCKDCIFLQHFRHVDDDVKMFECIRIKCFEIDEEYGLLKILDDGILVDDDDAACEYFEERPEGFTNKIHLTDQMKEKYNNEYFQAKIGKVCSDILDNIPDEEAKDLCVVFDLADDNILN